MTNLGAAALVCIANVPSATAQTRTSEMQDLMDFNCGQYLQAVRIVDVGPKPSTQRAN
jgi:altronate dehydratase